MVTANTYVAGFESSASSLPIFSTSDNPEHRHYLNLYFMQRAVEAQRC
jgi:hypothetical protein